MASKIEPLRYLYLKCGKCDQLVLTQVNRPISEHTVTHKFGANRIAVRCSEETPINSK